MSATGERVEVEIPLPPKAASPNRMGRHWGAKWRARKRYQAECEFDLRKVASRIRALPRPVVLEATFYLGRGATPGERYQRKARYFPRDEDNAGASLKGAIDALVTSGALADDSSAHLTVGRLRLLTRHKEHRGRAVVVLSFVGSGKHEGL
jgi:3',5'-cyclic AMP phosphodiesterase CpdA